MNLIEAKWVLLRELVQWQRRSYDELTRFIDKPHRLQDVTRCGESYQLEIMPVWDDEPKGAIRILGSVDDGGMRAYCPLSYGVLVFKTTADAELILRGE